MRKECIWTYWGGEEICCSGTVSWLALCIWEPWILKPLHPSLVTTNTGGHSCFVELNLSLFLLLVCALFCVCCPCPMTWQECVECPVFLECALRMENVIIGLRIMFVSAHFNESSVHEVVPATRCKPRCVCVFISSPQIKKYVMWMF